MFHYSDDKCYGIVPKERKDCGYFGIQREECEMIERCCFDHTVPNVPWCFKGAEATTAAPTEEPTEEASQEPTEEPAEGSTEEPTEGSGQIFVRAKICPDPCKRDL